MRITGLVAAIALSACYPVGVIGDGSGPQNSSSSCDHTEIDTCAIGHRDGNKMIAYAAIAAVLAAPMLLRLFYPRGSYHER